MEDKNDTSPPTESQNIGGDQIGYLVKGSNNIIGKNISVINQEIKPTGLTLLEPDYFERRKNVKDDFENWKKGYAFELPTIYYGYEFRRKNITDEIKQKLEANNKLLMLGESGTSKSTILMEIMCDYFRNGYKVLHNLDSTQLPQANEIVQYIEPLVKGKNKLLIAIDNAHDKKMSTIFNVIKQVSFLDSSANLLWVVTARLPEYDTLVSKRLLELDDQDRIALKKFNETPDIKYLIPYFKNTEEMEQFFTFYKTKYNVEKSGSKSYFDIFNETNGHPIMVKFFLLGKGLREDVENRYKFYLFDSETKKPIAENIKTMLICALHSISNNPITDKILDDMKVRRYAKSIIGILHRREDGTWTTIHSRWDMELFSYLFSSEDEDEIEDRKTIVSDASSSIFDWGDKQISLSVISALYDLAGEGQIPIDIVNDIVKIPDYILNDKGALYSLHVYYKSGAYYKLKMYYEMLFECDEAIKINENGVDALSSKGLALDSLGKHKEAIEWYDKVLKIDPNDAMHLYNKGVALDNLARHLDAIACYDKALEIDPMYVKALTNKGFALYNLRKYEEAIEWYDKALTIDLNDVYALNNKGLALKNLGKYQEAIEWYDKALKIDPNYGGALGNKGLAFDNLGKYQEAIDCHDKALNVNPNDVYALSNKGSALDSLGRHREAIEEFDKALKIDPNNDYALTNKGTAFINLGKSKEAIDEYDKALKIDPNNVYALNNKGNVLYSLGKYQDAIEWYDKVLAIDPNYALALTNKGNALEKLGKYQEIEDLTNKGNALYNLRKYQEAIELYDKVLKIDPNNVAALNNQGLALYNVGKYQEAVEGYDKVLKIDPNNVAALTNKGSALINLGKSEEAIVSYDKAIVIDRNYAPASFGKGNALYNLRKYQEAIDTYDNALEIDPKYVDSLISKGNALAILRKYQEAIEEYDKALKIDPNNVDALNNKGLLLKGLGGRTESKEYDDRAKEQTQKKSRWKKWF